MPYKIIKTTIYTKSSGTTWRKKQKCKSVASAKRALNLLQGLEAGSIKKSEVGKKKKKK